MSNRNCEFVCWPIKIEYEKDDFPIIFPKIKDKGVTIICKYCLEPATNGNFKYNKGRKCGINV